MSQNISLINVLNSEKRHKLYTELITIEPSLAGSSLDARSAVHGTTNEQNDLRNRAASRLTRGEPMSHQQKGIVKEIIKDIIQRSKPNISEANFIFREWLALYCNSTVDQAKKKKIADAKKHGLPLPQPKKKNIKPKRFRQATLIKPPNNKKRNMSDSITGSLQASGSTSTIILPTPISKANAPGTEDPPSPTPGEVNTSETGQCSPYYTYKKRKRKSSQTPVKTPKTSRITRSSSKKTD
ncbi:hypothetical protein RhiirA4_478856 [Rhizophagus irregularis]|uniref:Uncharacterized protein n=1 Tax=Rhizophagus irregularis TaxID=588596 RepID=A0A2I1HFM1_9GLOM|nr:hypothetical protein RhiirA4_478856 [Rhizophagus irregularis]